MTVFLLNVIVVLTGSLVGFFFGITILDTIFFHSDEKGAIAGMILGTIVGIIIIITYWIGMWLGILGKPKKCPKCGSRDTECVTTLYSPTGAFTLDKYVCHACEHKWEK